VRSSFFENPREGLAFVLRMPNPGSDIGVIIRIFQELYPDLSNLSAFGLDDITQAMTRRNNVTSQGALGEEALRRSTRADRSRDPLYNQSKMYAEVYRLLGLINSTKSALVYRFSLLGQHLASATDSGLLLKECLLGLAYPNRAVEVKGNNRVRLFACILRCMAALDGKISRDEIILGPMSITNDQDERKFQDLIRRLRELRRAAGGTKNALNDLSRKIGIEPTTMGNYTRIPIGALVWTGWAVKKEGYFHLTAEGMSVLKAVEQTRDIRIDDFDSLDDKLKAPLARVSFYEMLGRAGFDLTPVSSEFEKDRKVLAQAGFSPKQQILFSPFQQLDYKALVDAFGETPPITTPLHPIDISATSPSARRAPSSRITLRQIPMGSTLPVGSRHVRQILQEMLLQCANDRATAIEALHLQYETEGRDTFYPLVTTLFNIAGFRCELTRAGVNSARADAIIVLKDDTIPIEIKSPREETEISVKAVRQALENKIVFLSRKMYPCDPKSSALVVGFNPPNDRSEVHDLVEDVKKVFDVSIGIFDFRNLLALAFSNLTEGLRMDADDLRAVRGMVRVQAA
jgi:hypothetical protein